jgi:hypothetical protein
MTLVDLLKSRSELSFHICRVKLNGLAGPDWEEIKYALQFLSGHKVNFHILEIEVDGRKRTYHDVSNANGELKEQPKTV